MALVTSYRIAAAALQAGLTVFFLCAHVAPSRAQEPPLDVPIGGTLPSKPGEAIAFERWLLYPSRGWELQDAPPMLPAARYAEAFRSFFGGAP